MNYYCTLFDSSYLSRGLAMYESLKNHSGGFHLYIFAFDNLSYKILKQLILDYVTVIPLDEFETPELKSLKGTRTKGEYCWTCTPSVILHSLVNYNLTECTYIDSDLFFYSDPAILISEMKDSGKNVLITEHRFSRLPALLELKRAGRFCVQFLTISNIPASLEVLRKWQKQCNEWCFARYEEGKFGDQKYLEDWPVRYKNIHILQHHGGGLAPWNINQYSFKGISNRIEGYHKKSSIVFDPVFYHFQYVKMKAPGIFDIGWYFISQNIRKLFYIPYLIFIQDIEKKLIAMNMGYNTIYIDNYKFGLKNFIKKQIKNIFSYNILVIS